MAQKYKNGSNVEFKIGNRSGGNSFGAATVESYNSERDVYTLKTPNGAKINRKGESLRAVT